MRISDPAWCCSSLLWERSPDRDLLYLWERSPDRDLLLWERSPDRDGSQVERSRSGDRSHREGQSRSGDRSHSEGEGRRARGFTLLELLVVVALVAILTGTVMLSITGADSEQRLKGSAEQLAYRVELARQYALQRNREWGLYVDDNGVRFAEFDPGQSAWIEQTVRPFGGTVVIENVQLRSETEGFAGLSPRDRERLPQVLVFSSGEVTPFKLFLEPQWDGRVWVVSSDGLSPVRAAPAEI